MTYKWYFSSGDKFYLTTAFTSNTYEVEMNSSRSGRQLYCVVTDAAGNKVQTNTVTISMATAAELAIIKQPESVCVPEGEMATVTFEAQGEGLTYKWYFSSGDKFYYTATFTTNTYAVAMNSSRDGRRVYCVVIDASGNKVQTNTVTISMMEELREGDFVYEVVDSSIVIVRYIGNDQSVTVPATINDLPVTGIGEGAFEGNTTLMSIDLPDSIMTIGSRAFANCTNLSEIK